MNKSLVAVAVLTVAVLAAALSACGGDDDGQNPGDCGQDVCIITQTGCSTDFACGGAASYSGTVSGNHVDYDGHAADGTPGMCSGTVSGDTITGTCTIMGFTCGFNADPQ